MVTVGKDKNRDIDLIQLIVVLENNFFFLQTSQMYPQGQTYETF